jgi:hypothetical protein
VTNEAFPSERLGAEVFSPERSGAGNRGVESRGAETGTRSSSTVSSGARLLTPREGRALTNVALQEPIASEKPDCSHLVHQVLNDAGLTYPYATSSEIFAGIPQFRRVRHAQPGDLIVWRGHVGLVVDPKQTTFFSSTNSGLHTDEYTSDYWRNRGYHRFYRYIVTPTTRLAAYRLTEEPAAKPTHHAQATASSEASRAQHMARETLGASQPSSEAAVASETSPTEISPDDAALPSPSRDFPESMPIDSGMGRPTKHDLEQAISELTNASTAALEAAHGSSMPVVFVRSWKVEKIKIKGDEGWVELRVNTSGERTPAGTWKKLRVQKLHCDLRRDQTGWVVFPPRDRLYVSAQSR